MKEPNKTGPETMILPLLREIRQDMNARFDVVDARFDTVDQRLERIETRQKSFNNALTADTMMSKFVTGDFEERIEALEKKVDALLKAR